MGIVVGPKRTLGGKKAFSDLVEIEFNPGGSANSVANPPGLSEGVPSLFNPYAIVVFPALNHKVFRPTVSGESEELNTNRLMDNGVENFTPKIASNPSIQMLVDDPTNAISDKMPYYYTDFAYCKYVGKIPNNQLVTLRRYPAPTFDNLEVPSAKKDSPTQSTGFIGNNALGGQSSSDVDVQSEFFPIAQAVTWFGEATNNKLSEILSFSVGLNWKQIEAEVNTVAGNEQGSEDSPLPGVSKFIGILTGNVNSNFANQNSQYDPYNNGPYSNRVYGPVNVISKTFKRERGLEYKQTMSLTFEYSLKSIGNINPKAAMLDLMSNLLALTYNNAAFWGGANRYFPQKPTYPFLGGKNGMNAWYKGDPVGFTKSVGSQVSSAGAAFMDLIGKLAEDPIATLKSIATGAAKLGMMEMGKGRAPNILAIKSLLTGEPIGEWHVVIGNPFAPIAKIGNLICTESKFQFNDIIGADNFPTELKVTITVEHGRPRDAGDIQSIFNEGQGRIYYPSKGSLDVLNASSATEDSKNDTSWKTGANELSSNKVTSSFGLFTGSASDFDNVIGGVKNSATNGLSTGGKNAWKLADKMFLRSAGSQTNSTK